MPEKFEHLNKSSQEISQYLAERLKRENIAKESDQKKEKITAHEEKEKAEELADLTFEKEYLLKAGAADEKALGEGDQKKRDYEEIVVDKNNLDVIDFRRLSRNFDPDLTTKESFAENKEQLKLIEQKIAALSVNEKILKAYQEILEKKIDAIKMARQVEGARGYLEGLDLADAKFMARRNNEDIKLSKADKKILAEHDSQRQMIEEKTKEWMSVPEVYFEVNRRQMLDYRRQLLKGGIVEAPSVKKEISQILGHLRLGIPVFLRGHLGAGKTEMLLHIARKYFKTEPEFISGSEELTKYDIICKTAIGIKPKEEREKDFKKMMEEYKERRPAAGENELKKAADEFYENWVIKGQVASYPMYGPVARAMKYGKPVIFDEMDGIPHSILMRMNHYLTRKAGDKVTIQENSNEEIFVEKGFCAMATGNIKSAKYKREELDAAFLSRWWSSEIRYLPQDETLKILAASLIDKRGNLELSSSEDFGALKRLTQSAEEIQKIFTGEKTDVFGVGGDAARGVSASLEKSVLSMRDLWNIVKPWKAKNFDKPLDEYILSEFIKKATVPKDQIYLTQLFCRFGFFKDWEAEKFGITGLDKKKLEAFRAKK